mgnify:CR=1 FL=1
MEPLSYLAKRNDSEKAKEPNYKHVWDNPAKHWVFDVKCIVTGTLGLLISFRVHARQVATEATYAMIK